MTEGDGQLRAWRKGLSASGAMFGNPWTNPLKELIKHNRRHSDEVYENGLSLAVN